MVPTPWPKVPSCFRAWLARVVGAGFMQHVQKISRFEGLLGDPPFRPVLVLRALRVLLANPAPKQGERESRTRAHHVHLFSAFLAVRRPVSSTCASFFRLGATPACQRDQI